MNRDPRTIVRKVLITEKGTALREMRNQYFFEVFDDVAEVQFEVDVGRFATCVTRLERMVRNAERTSSTTASGARGVTSVDRSPPRGTNSPRAVGAWPCCRDRPLPTVAREYQHGSRWA